jgi:hypothetical protein
LRCARVARTAWPALTSKKRQPSKPPPPDRRPRAAGNVASLALCWKRDSSPCLRRDRRSTIKIVRNSPFLFTVFALRAVPGGACGRLSFISELTRWAARQENTFARPPKHNSAAVGLGGENRIVARQPPGMVFDDRAIHIRQPEAAASAGQDASHVCELIAENRSWRSRICSRHLARWQLRGRPMLADSRPVQTPCGRLSREPWPVVNCVYSHITPAH